LFSDTLSLCSSLNVRDWSFTANLRNAIGMFTCSSCVRTVHISPY
jgi:hypothetical protein